MIVRQGQSSAEVYTAEGVDMKNVSDFPNGFLFNMPGKSAD